MDDTDPLSFFLFSHSINNEMSFWFSVVCLLLLLLGSALMSASEVAFFSLSPEEREEIKDSKGRKFELIMDWLGKPKTLLAIILISNNFINVSAVILASYIFNQIYPVDPLYIGVDYIRSIIEIGGITFILVLIGEITPKVYANRNALQVAKLMAQPLYIINKIPPFSWLRAFLVNGTDVILKYARKRKIDVSTAELESAIALTNEDDVTQEEQKILKGIVNFGNKDVKQIMRSRMDTVSIDGTVNYEELMKIILEHGYSRIPVYQEKFDNVLGILYVKDLLKHLSAPSDFEWSTLIRPALFVPENKKIDDLLKQFQEKKMHMAVVVDEYGGASGIVTMEDILEEIVGEITDEFDDEDIIYTKIDDSTYLFEGKTSLVDMYKVLDIDGKDFEDEKGESDSIGGFLVEHSGRILKNNESLKFGDFKFVVESSDKKRVKLVKVIKQK
ncbi:MAG: gliding motility-associated protein GldE [Brumimicrobium sp.]|nr:gliding motility-associated protein GldE [Brumimicrobium sp.]